MTTPSFSNPFGLPSLALLLFLTACGSDGTGSVADPETPETPAPSADDFVAAPPETERVTLELEEFDLAPGGETYKCQNFENPFGRDVAIVQSQSLMSRGSHHLAVFRFDENANGPIEACGGLEFHGIIHAAQTPTARTTYPEGVGAFHLGVDGIRLNAHYFNLSEETIRAKVRVVLDYVDGGAITHKAAKIYMNDSTIDVPPGMGTAGGTLAIPPEVGDIKLLRVQSHMHRRGRHFVATLEDGTTLYETETWDEPVEKVYDPEVPLAAGSSITWQCDIENETSANLRFGESADRDEMCVLTGFYYPAPDGQTLVGDLLLGNMALTR